MEMKTSHCQLTALSCLLEIFHICNKSSCLIISEKQVNNMEEEGIRFYIGDQLPIRYDVAMAISSVCPSSSRAGRQGTL